MSSLEQLVITAQADFLAAADPAALENAKAKYLGKTGQITEQMKGLGKLGPDERRAQGAVINQAKEQIEALLNARRDALANAQMQARLDTEAIDITLPGRGRGVGGIHPVMRSWQRVEEIFGSIGFDVADGPEIENDWTNFTALNSPENHPARSMQDTFYIDANDSTGKPLLLRTHTSPMQVRYARMQKPPIKVIAPGRTYRVDSDATHSPICKCALGLRIFRLPSLLPRSILRLAVARSKVAGLKSPAPVRCIPPYCETWDSIPSNLSALHLAQGWNA